MKSNFNKNIKCQMTDAIASTLSEAIIALLNNNKNTDTKCFFSLFFLFFSFSVVFNELIAFFFKEIFLLDQNR